IPGATVYVREWAVDHPKVPQHSDILARTVTDTKGRFRFRDVPVRPLEAYLAQQYPWELVAVAQGKGLVWLHLIPHVQRQPLELHLLPEVPVRGQLTEAGGRPVAGVRVKVRAVAPVGTYIELGSPHQKGVLNLASSRIPLSTTFSDQRGRFTLTGMPAGVRCVLAVNSANHVDQTVYAATTKEPQPDEIKEAADAMGRTVVYPVHTGPMQ